MQNYSRAESVSILNVEHRTPNIERPMLMFDVQYFLFMTRSNYTNRILHTNPTLTNRRIIHQIPHPARTGRGAKTAADAQAFIDHIFIGGAFGLLFTNSLARANRYSNPAIPARAAGRTLRTTMVQTGELRHPGIKIFNGHPVAAYHFAFERRRYVALQNIANRQIGRASCRERV